jgi:hypothetical protein
MTSPTLRFDSIRKPQSCLLLESEAATTVPSSPRQGDDFSPYLTEAGLEVCEVVNEVPDEHLQTLLDTLPVFRLEWFAGFPVIGRLFGGRENGGKKEEAVKKYEKGKKRPRGGVAAQAPPVKLPKLETAPTPAAAPVPSDTPAPSTTPTPGPTERRPKTSHSTLYDLLEAKKQEAAAKAKDAPSQKPQLRRKPESTEDLYASLGLTIKR